MDITIDSSKKTNGTTNRGKTMKKHEILPIPLAPLLLNAFYVSVTLLSMVYSSLHLQNGSIITRNEGTERS